MSFEESDLFNAIYVEVLTEIMSPKDRVEDTADAITEKLIQVFKDFQSY